MKKYFNLKNQFLVLSAVLMFTVIISLMTSYAAPINEASSTTVFDYNTIVSNNPDIKRIADTNTINNYKQLFTTQDKYDGRVWTDKSVYSYDDTKGTVKIDNTSINFDTDFLNVFSALNSNQTNKKNIVPVDLELVIDVTASMYTGTPGKDDDHLTVVIEAANQLMEKVKNNIPNSQIGVIFYLGNAFQAVPLTSYLPKINKKYSTEKKSDHTNVIIRYTLTDTKTGEEVSEVEFNAFEGTCKLISGKALPEGINIEKNYIGGTNYQSAFVTGLKNLSENKNKTYTTSDGTVLTKTPAVVFLGDGKSNTFLADNGDSDVEGEVNYQKTPSSVTTSGNWWDPKDPKVGVASPSGVARIFKPLLNIAYWKKVLANSYKISTNNVQIYTIGFKAGEKSPVLDPLNGFIENSDYKNFYNNFLSWKNGTIETLTIEGNATSSDFYHVLNRPKTEYKFNQLPADDKYGIKTSDLDLNYPTKYYKATENNIAEVFNQVYNSLTTYTYVENPLKANTTLKYSDQIGENLEIKNVTNLLLFGQNYNIKKREATSVEKSNQKSGTTYTYYEVNNTDTIINHGYDEYYSNNTKVATASFKLSDIKIWVETTNNIQTLYVDIPSKLVPILNVRYEIDDKGVITYTSNENTNESLPLRIIYTVGIKNNYIDKFAKLNLDLVSKDYISKNLVKKNNKEYIYFYANYYDKSHSYGNAKTTYTIADINQHYLNQNNLIIYKTSKNGDSNGEGILKETGGNVVLSDKIAKLENIDKNATYYYIKEYYTKGENNNAKLVKYATAIKGSNLDLVYYNEETNEVVDEAGKNVVLATKIGSTINNNLNSTTNKSSNSTETASIVLSSNYNNKNITDYLGNNGRLEVLNNRNLEIRKEVTGTSGDKNKVWTFQIKLTPKTGITLNTTYSYKGGSFIDGVTKASDGKITFTRQSNGSYVGKIQLKHGQSATIMDIEEGTAYEITEEDANLDNYNLKATNNKSLLTSDKLTEMQNVKGIDLPKTGELGTILPYIVGVLFVIWGITTFLLISKKKKTN